MRDRNWYRDGLLSASAVQVGGGSENKEIIKIRLRRHERASRADDPAWLTNERGD
jgi:hypothetical protein